MAYHPHKVSHPHKGMINVNDFTCKKQGCVYKVPGDKVEAQKDRLTELYIASSGFITLFVLLYVFKWVRRYMKEREHERTVEETRKHRGKPP